MDLPAVCQHITRQTTMSFRPLYYVIPSVAEESKNPEMESTAGISDSSATLGMT